MALFRLITVVLHSRGSSCDVQQTLACAANSQVIKVANQASDSLLSQPERPRISVLVVTQCHSTPRFLHPVHPGKYKIECSFVSAIRGGVDTMAGVVAVRGQTCRSDLLLNGDPQSC